jgi:hypothetical protein
MTSDLVLKLVFPYVRPRDLRRFALLNKLCRDLFYSVKKCVFSPLALDNGITSRIGLVTEHGTMQTNFYIGKRRESKPCCFVNTDNTDYTDTTAYTIDTMRPVYSEGVYKYNYRDLEGVQRYRPELNVRYTIDTKTITLVSGQYKLEISKDDDGCYEFHYYMGREQWLNVWRVCLTRQEMVQMYSKHGTVSAVIINVMRSTRLFDPLFENSCYHCWTWALALNRVIRRHWDWTVVDTIPAYIWGDFPPYFVKLIKRCVYEQENQ